MDILITGISGFVGSYLTREWRSKYTLYGISQNKKQGVQKTWTWEELQSLPEVDVIVHLAGKAHDVKDTSAESIYFEINTELTKKIFDFFLTSECRTFIFFSSVKAVADYVPGDILREDVEPRPIGPYGESKIKAEEYILSKLPMAHALGKKVYILRPCMIHGPGNKGNLNLLYKVVSARVPWPLGAYENKRSFCSIENISYVVEQLTIRTDIESGIYNVCDDDPLSTNDLIDLISTTLGRSGVIWKLPQGVINFLASVGQILHLPLTKERLVKLTENYVVSNDKIKNALGISKMPITASDGIISTIRSFR